MFSWKGLHFNIDDTQVYPPKPASLLLAEWAIKTVPEGAKVLDVFSGSGVVGIVVAQNKPGAAVTLSDISSEAMEVALKNAMINHVKVDAVTSDMFHVFRGHKFDVITAHPPAIPYLPGEDWSMTDGMRIATDGGEDGSRFVIRTIEETKEHLEPGGFLLLLLPHWSNVPRAHEALRQTYGGFEELDRTRIEFFPLTEGKPNTVLIEHLHRLSERGMIDLVFEGEKIFSTASVIKATR